MNKTKRIAFISLFAALCYVSFTYLKLDLTIASGNIAIHSANAIVVVSALLLGPLDGALAGAIGLSIADLFDPRYIQFLPMTFLLKFMIGYSAGKLANTLKLKEEVIKKRIITKSVACASLALGLNVIIYPLFRYVYYNYLLGITSEFSLALVTMTSVVTLVNAIVSIILAVVLYNALRKPFLNIVKIK